MRLRLNLSTTPQENNRPFIAGAAVLGGLGLIALLLLSHAAYDSWQSNRELRADISHWQQQVRADTSASASCRPISRLRPPSRSSTAPAS